jgi:hypothetical protein
MTTMANLNAGSNDRKTLASQLDRLDRILDGLADGLTEAMAAAVTAAVGQAVERAVAGVLSEILTNPAFVDRLRGATPAPASEKTPVPETVSCPPCPSGPLQRARGWLRAGWSKARQVAGGVLRHATAAAVRTYGFIRDTFRRVGLVALIVAASVGAVLGYLGGPTVMALLSGAAAWLAVRGSQLAGWLGRGWSWGLSG